MKRIVMSLTLVAVALFAGANNLQLSNFKVNDPTHIQFDVKWDNSWKVSTGPANWDAVWIFLKAQDCSSAYQLWQHVDVSVTSSDHTVSGGILAVDASSDGKGVFLRRIANGNGNISTATVVLKISAPDNGFNYQVNGIEMVYVPQGAFYVGDGNRCGGSQYGFTGDAALAPKLIDAAVQSGGLTSAQYLSNASWGSTAALPATFPFGYNGFYTMKYEVSQEEYCAFLNTLSYDQQVARFVATPNSSTGSLVVSTSSVPANCRNWIKIKTPGVVNNVPAVVGCDMNNNGTFDETDDGKDVACNWLSWADLTAYLDWAALRPMSEFEFEKVCRGIGNTPVANEYPWGTTTILASTAASLAYPGAPNEISLTTGHGLCVYAAGTTTSRGPLRTGSTATNVTTRVLAGASFYGAMDMAGNVAEQCVGGMSFNYSGFTVANGDGKLTSDGRADTASWPQNGGGDQGGIMRGGNWYDNAWQHCIVSNRDWLNNGTNRGRDFRVGGRGVRSF